MQIRHLPVEEKVRTDYRQLLSGKLGFGRGSSTAWAALGVPAGRLQRCGRMGLHRTSGWLRQTCLGMQE